MEAEDIFISTSDEVIMRRPTHYEYQNIVERVYFVMYGNGRFPDNVGRAFEKRSMVMLDALFRHRDDEMAISSIANPPRHDDARR